jgi:hypothetical protein
VSFQSRSRLAVEGGSLYQNGLLLGLERSEFALKIVSTMKKKGNAAKTAKKVAVA